LPLAAETVIVPTDSRGRWSSPGPPDRADDSCRPWQEFFVSGRRDGQDPAGGDTRERIEAFLPLVDAAITEGLATLEQAEIRFYRAPKAQAP